MIFESHLESLVRFGLASKYHEVDEDEFERLVAQEMERLRDELDVVLHSSSGREDGG